MPKKANRESGQAYVRANTIEEMKKIRGMKEICIRNDIEIRTVLLKGIDTFLREHNWPPGDSQTVLATFGAQVLQKCFKCKELKPELIPVEFISGLRRSICPECLRKDEEGPRLVRKRLL